MKKILMIMMLAAISLCGYSQTSQGDQSVGFNIGYAFDTENAAIGLDYRYNVTNEFRLAPSLTYLTKHKSLSAWMIDMNVHYVFQLSDMFGFYPLGGLSLAVWDSKYWDDSETRVGLNIGMGGEVYATKEISVGLEVKYNIVKDVDQALIGVRVGYNF